MAFVLTRSGPIGGAQLHVLELACGLQRAGHEVMVFVGGEGPLVERLRQRSVPVWPIADLVREIHPIRDLRALAQLRRAIADFGPDLVTTHSSKAGWLGRAVAAALRIPVIFVVHGWLFRAGELSPYEQVTRVVEWCAAPLAERLLAVCRYDRDIGVERGISSSAHFSVVHNGIPDLPPGQLRADPRRGPPRIVMVSRFAYPKDPVTVIRALAQLRELDWEFELIGDGPDRPQVEAALRECSLGDRVKLMGTRNDVPERLAAAQLFVLVSMREGFPLSVLEAMRAGLPVVAASVGGISEAVEEGRSGHLVPPADPDALAAALRPLIEDAELRGRYGEAARARFEAEFEFEVHLRRTWAVYADVIEGGSQPLPAKLASRIRI